MTGHYEPQLIDGYKFDEVASALQKVWNMIRSFGHLYFTKAVMDCISGGESISSVQKMLEMVTHRQY